MSVSPASEQCGKLTSPASARYKWTEDGRVGQHVQVNRAPDRGLAGVVVFNCFSQKNLFAGLSNENTKCRPPPKSAELELNNNESNYLQSIEYYPFARPCSRAATTHELLLRALSTTFVRPPCRRRRATAAADAVRRPSPQNAASLRQRLPAASGSFRTTATATTTTTTAVVSIRSFLFTALATTAAVDTRPRRARSSANTPLVASGGRRCILRALVVVVVPAVASCGATPAAAAAARRYQLWGLVSEDLGAGPPHQRVVVPLASPVAGRGGGGVDRGLFMVVNMKVQLAPTTLQVFIAKPGQGYVV